METILFQQSFPKQPMTRSKRIVMYIDDEKSFDDHGKFVVHDEYLADDGKEYFRSHGFYGQDFSEALKEYTARCKNEMKWYVLPGAWAHVNAEIIRHNNR